MNTLEAVRGSKFAAHIKEDINSWLKKLKVMQTNLEIWIDAQKYWINLDIVFNSGLFQNMFGDKTKLFIKTRL